MLKKLSLAAVIAMGSMSVASATPLTEAIKNVNLNGFLRVRLYNEDPESKSSYNRWRTNAVLIFKVPVSEEIKFVMRNSVQTNVFTNKKKLDPADTKSTNVDDAMVNNLLFMQYSHAGFNVNIGKIPVPTTITSADPAAPGHGAGVIATYKINENLTGAVAFVDALKNPGNNTGVAALKLIGNDIYAVAAIFNVENVKGNVWYYHATDLIDNIITASIDVKVPQIENIALHADYAQGKLEKEAGLTTDTHRYYNISAKYSQDALTAQLGYASTNDEGDLVELSVDAPIGDVLPVEQRYNIANEMDVSAIYVKLAYNVDPKTTVYAGYVNVDQGEKAGDNDSNEYKIGAKYKYNKKLGFDIYYDAYDADAKGTDNNEFRFEALYKF